MELIDYGNCDIFANPYIVKCVKIGDHGIGKSTMGNMFIDEEFDTSITSTIGISFFDKTITLDNYNCQKLKLQIWDTAGSEKYRSIVRTYLRDVYLGIIMFDMTDRSTWDHIDTWKEQLDNGKTCEVIPHIVLVGTKSDKNYYAISEKEIKEKAEEWGCNYYILSSKSKHSYRKIYHMFVTEANNLHKKMLQSHIRGEEVPFRVLRENEEKQALLYSTENKINWCCF